MRFLVSLLFLSLGYFSINNAKAQYVPTSQDLDDLNYIFMNYQSSIMSNDIPRVISYMDTSTIRIFNRTFYALKNSDSTALINQDFSVITSVIYSRFMAPEGEISKMNNVIDFLGFYNKINFQSDIAQQRIIDIKIEDDVARIYTTLSGYDGADMKTYYFIKYGDGDWKISYAIAFQEFNDKMNAEMANSGTHSKEDIINALISSQGYNALNKNVWHIVK